MSFLDLFRTRSDSVSTERMTEVLEEQRRVHPLLPNSQIGCVVSQLICNVFAIETNSVVRSGFIKSLHYLLGEKAILAIIDDSNAARSLSQTTKDTTTR
jgi:hypothetical protein